MHPWDVTADELERWAASASAKAILPALVHRLLFATARATKVDFPSDASVFRGGHDGELDAVDAGPFWPAGRSIWELSTDARPLQKISADYEKRKKLAKRSDHYVAVTARRTNKQTRAWVAARQADNAFASVTVLDADDLSQWLSTASAVLIWFRQRELGAQGVRDITTLEQALDAWQNETSLPFDPQLLLLGRERQNLAAQLRAWADGESDAPLALTSIEPHEAAMFAASALAYDPLNAERWKARAVVVASRDALRLVESLQETRQLIPILDFQSNDPIRQDRRLVVTHHTGAMQPHQSTPLPEIAWSVLAEGLTRFINLAPHDAEVRARDARGSLAAVRQPLRMAPSPAWVTKFDADVLSSLLLLGGLAPRSEQQLAFLAAVLGRDPAEILTTAQQLVTEHASPIVINRTYRGEWLSFVSHREAWSHLASRISESLLERFVTAAIGVFTGAVDLDAASVRSIALSVARLGWSDAPHSAKSSASRIVRNTLHQAPVDRWIALDRALPLLAEASPAEFIDAALGGTANGALLALTTNRNHSPLVNLLWALQRVGWDERCFADVVEILARLADVDEPNNLQPRPLGVLASLLDIRVPQTNASDTAIVAAMALLSRHDKIAFAIFERNLGIRGFYMEQHPPDVMPMAIKQFAERATERRAGVRRRYDATVESLLKLAGNTEDRWTALVGKIRSEERFLTALELRVASIAGPRTELWTALRELLHNDAWFAALESTPQASRLLTQSERARVRGLYDAMTPSTMSARIQWLFQFNAKLPDVVSADWRAEQAEVERERALALDAVYAADGINGVLAFVCELPDAVVAQSAIYAAAFREECVSSIEQRADARLDVLWSILVVRDARDTKRDLVAVLGRALGFGLPAAREVVARLPQNDATWHALGEVGGELERDYWRGLAHLFDDANRPTNEAAIKSLITHGNLKLAFHAVVTAPDRVSEKLALSVLDVALSKREPWLRDDHIDLTYWLPRMFDRMRMTNSVAADEIALLALRAWRMIDRYDDFGGLDWATPAFESYPQMFTQILALAHGAPVEPIDALPDLTQDEAGRIVYAWNGTPYSTAEDAQLQWVLTVYVETTKRLRTASSALPSIADIVARAPSNDGRWPGITARRLIDNTISRLEWNEELAGDFAHSLEVSRFNMRGVHTRNMGDGGRQERVLSETYRQDANALRSQWPATARMLDRVARNYESDAQMEDAATRTMAREEGFELTGVTAFDLLVAIVLSTISYDELDSTRLQELATALSVTVPELVVSLRTLSDARMLHAEERRVNRLLLRHFLLQTPFPFPIPRESTTHGAGLPTASSTSIIEAVLGKQKQAFVMPLEGGALTGVVVEPFDPRAPLVASKSSQIQTLLGLVDVLRWPSADPRTVAVAREKLAELL